LLPRPGFLSHLRSFNGYDGPETLPSSTHPICLIGADAGHTLGHNLITNGVDDPDQTLYEFYTCNAEANYDGYCSAELDNMVDQQSMEFDQKKRKQLVWQIEKKLAEDVARPILYHSRSGTCWHPYVKGYTVLANSVYNGQRMEDVWLDQ